MADNKPGRIRVDIDAFYDGESKLLSIHTNTISGPVEGLLHLLGAVTAQTLHDICVQQHLNSNEALLMFEREFFEPKYTFVNRQQVNIDVAGALRQFHDMKESGELDDKNKD